jgi:hypothetical protein
MSWLYSQALVEEYLGESSLDGEQSAPLSGNPIQQAYCAPDKMTVFSRLSRFGMTYKPLMESRGEELLTLYLEDFHVKTLAQQEKAQELTENEAECGERWRASFTKYDLDSSSWKTHQCSLLGGLDEFLETWPQWGLMRDGECWEQRTLEQTIRGTESGLSEKWATPTTMDKLPPKSEQALLKEATFARPGRSKPANLRDQVSNMQNWKICKERIPTPTARDGSGVRGKAAQERKGNPIDTVPIYVQKYPTPVSRMWKDNGKSPAELNRNTETLATKVGGSLNPTWVEWLMGWPLEWTDLKPLETDKSLCAPQQLGES